MSPVHVMVGEDARAEMIWSRAFPGAVDLYRFARNAEAFERLTAAEAPVDLIILTPAQHGPFNLTPDQFVARVLEGPLANTRNLVNLHVIVVGQTLSRSHPRVASVSTLDAAIRLVKFGEIERAPRPAAIASVAPVTRSAGGTNDLDAMLGGEGAFSRSVISRIWDAGDAAAREESAPEPELAPEVIEPREITGGGATSGGHRPSASDSMHAQAEPSAPVSPELFSRTAPAGFVIDPDALAAGAPVVGGGDVAPSQVGAPGESIEVASGALQPARPFELPNGGGYRGPALRGGQIHTASHAAVSGGAPVPPALAAQVHTMVYGGAIVADPLLVWSSSTRGQIVTAGVPVPVGAPAAQVPAPVQQMQPAATLAVVGGGPMQQQQHQQHAPLGPQIANQLRTVPMQPPAGVYGNVTGQQAPAAPIAAQSYDPFLARAEQAGGVQFG